MKEKETLKNLVYRSILQGILADEYKPNQIITEKELVEKYGYSKSPIREALIALCNEGVLVSHPRYGYEVIRLSRDNVDDIMEYRYILESGVIRDYIERIRPQDLKRLIELNEACVTSLSEDVWAHWEANTEFHLALASFTNNHFLRKQLKQAMCVLKRAYAQYYWQEWSKLDRKNDVRFHDELIEHLKEKNLDAALLCLKEDLADFCI